MSDLIRRSDVKRDYEKHFSELSKSAVHFSMNDIFNNLDNIRSVPALELNEDLAIYLKQLGYEKVVHCKDCLKYGTENCDLFDYEYEMTPGFVTDDYFCKGGDKK